MEMSANNSNALRPSDSHAF